MVNQELKEVEIAKKDHIILQIGRTEKKNYENYCITRIYHLLNRTDVQFVTQQMLKRNDNQIALADLYLPQLDVWVEIDEGHHLNQTQDDLKRTEEILIENKTKHLEEVITINQEPYRIIVFDKSIKEINEQIDIIIKNIKNIISNLEKINKFVPWNILYEKPEYYIKKMILDTKDRPVFRTIYDLSKLFNKNYKKGCQRAWFVDKPQSKIMVWCPKLKFNESDQGKWDNFITPDGKIIYESNSKDKFGWKGYIRGYNNGYTTRYVFAKFKDSSGINMYRFRGVFELDEDETSKHKKAIWKKVRNEIDLSGYFS